MRTCSECRGEGKVNSPAEKVSHFFENLLEGMKTWVPILAMPFFVPALFYVIVRFPLFMLSARTDSGTGEMCLWFATILGSVVGTIMSGFAFFHEMERK